MVTSKDFIKYNQQATFKENIRIANEHGIEEAELAILRGHGLDIGRLVTQANHLARHLADVGVDQFLP